MTIMSHENCGLDLIPVNQIENSHVRKLANKIDISDQSEEEGLHQWKEEHQWD